LERLDYVGQMPEAGAVLGISLESDSTVSGRAAHQPGWLRGASALAASGTPTSSQGAVPLSQGKDEVPDVVRPGGRSESTRITEEPRTSASGSESELAAVQGDLPEWVKALAPAGDGEPATQLSAPISESPSDLADMPEWLRNLGGDQPAAVASSSAAAVKADSPGRTKNLGGQELEESVPGSKPSSETDWSTGLKADQPSGPEVPPVAGAGLQPSHELSPNWLKDFDSDLEKPSQKTAAGAVETSRQPAPAQPSSNLASIGTTAQEQNDDTALPEGLAAEHRTKPEELVTGPNPQTDAAPQSGDKTQEMGEQAPDSAPVPSESAAGATDIGPRNLRPGAAEGSIPKLEVPGPLDLRRGLADQNDFAVMGSDGEQEKTPIMDERDTRDSLSNLEENPAAEIGRAHV
jgi:hypothetical protein